MYAVSLVVVMICLWTYVAELLDTWDHTWETGNDIESTVALSALCVGTAVVFVRILFNPLRSFVLGNRPAFLSQHLSACVPEAVPSSSAASPPPLRL